MYSHIEMKFCIQIRAVRCTEIIGAPRFGNARFGFGSGIPKYDSVRTLYVAFRKKHGRDIGEKIPGVGLLQIPTEIWERR